ncbi:ABC transporter permease [Oleidesulfovibrio sp.]|uniref:ABC transporter permease n=1 Tax=Oleidesulfovibrio sp. TaxID=2909707 RepID=UPI003A834FE5
MTLKDMHLALTLATRELRSGKRRFTVFLLCLFLGVFAIAAVGSISESARSAISRDARVLMGGDAAIQLATPQPSADEVAWLQQYGTTSHTITLRGIARAENGESALVSVKGVDHAYPLYGSVELRPELSAATPLSHLLSGADSKILKNDKESERPQKPTVPEDKTSKYSSTPATLPAVIADELLLTRLGINVGEILRIGTQQFIVKAALIREPDRAFQGVTFGPRIIMSLQSLHKTGLILPGSLLHSRMRIRLDTVTGRPATETQVGDFTQEARTKFDDHGWRVEPYTRAAPRIRSILDRLDMDLMLIGLAALLIGGLGIAEAVRGYLASRVQNMATMKCVGGGVSTVIWTYYIQILLIGTAGIVAGCIAGTLVPYAASGLLGTLLPVPLDTGIHLKALLRAALLGFAIITAFSLRPLLQAGGVSPAVLFRGYVANAETSMTAKGRLLLLAAFGVLTGLVFLFTPDKRMAWGFVGLTILCTGVFRIVAWGLQVVTKKLPAMGHPSLRLGLSSIHRPGAPTVHLVFALGLGLTALVAIAQIEQNLSATLQRDLSRDAPAFFFINVLPDQRPQFTALGEQYGTTRMEQGPMVRGRIVRIAGVPVADAEISPDVRWAVRGDRGLSQAAAQPQETEITAGEWWPENYSGPPIISLTADLAKGFGVTVGDTLTFNILGREIKATIANIRKVDWMTFQLQFAVLFAPGLLDNAPVTWVVTAYGKGENMDRLYRNVTSDYPNVTVFSMREILADVRGLMERMGIVFRAMAAVLLATGLMVLAGAIMADRNQRIYDAVIYKVCGATRKDIMLALITEFLASGLATGIFSAFTGTVAAWAAVSLLMKLPFSIQPVAIIATIVAGAMFALLFGLAGTVSALGKRPAPYLRNE